ncbi:MAG TPA: D-2-hydroxyacid dehydrogenase [Candidatus Latescibacteria bacterium]|nr:D-2-hydroxyacid dehydrogenase [Candidatus Latescibacterota bacterium]HQK22411.1 D-2-hydroxyacid dehydrogenase [Candidatus Latescibacterota bacterium]HRS95362.1 D-2-hydroxyacid dehydrogenase [Candidatus Latescibacterota bacterium]
MHAPEPITMITFERWPEPWMEELRAAAPGSTIFRPQSREGIDWASLDALNGGINKDILAKAARLRWFHSPAAGVEGYLFPEMVESPVVLTNSKGVYSIFIAELAMGHLLALTTQVHANTVRPDRLTWLRDTLRGFELYGATAVVIGLGNIGSEVADRAKAFRMRVIGVDPVRKAAAGVELVRPDRIDDVLPLADVIFITAPATTARKLFDRERLQSLKKGAYLINSSRGPVVDTDALVEALRSGHLGGAGLDVTDPEPLPADHPLWTLPNVTITPHIGGMTDAVDRRRFVILRENLWRFVRGVPLLNVVNKKRGF